MANSYWNVTGLAVQYGLNSAMRTLAPQVGWTFFFSLSSVFLPHQRPAYFRSAGSFFIFFPFLISHALFCFKKQNLQAVGSGRSRELSGIHVQRGAVIALVALIPSILLACCFFSLFFF